MWILLFALFDVAFSSYSEDQCSWRGRQVSALRVICFILQENVRSDATGGFYLRNLLQGKCINARPGATC